LREIIFFTLAFLCEIIGTIGGFGSSVFFVPIAGIFYSFNIVLGITGVFHVFSNLSKLLLFGKHTQYKLLLFFGLPSIFFVFLGSWLTVTYALSYAQLTLGIFLIIFSLAMLVFKQMVLKANAATSITTGAIAGFLAGLNGTGGVIRGLGLAAFNLEKSAFVATSAAIDFGVDLVRSAVYIYNGFFTKNQIYLIPFLILVSFAGTYIGKKILDSINQNQFRQFVLFLILVIGILIIVLNNKLFFIK